MSVKSFNHEKSSFTLYQNSFEQKELSLFSKLNLNQNDQNSLEHPMRNFNDKESSDLFSMRSKRRKRSVELQLKESLTGNKNFLNLSLVGKSSLVHNDLFVRERDHDIGSGADEDQIIKQFSEKSCPVGPSYSFEEQSEGYKIIRHNNENQKPRFQKTKNMLRTISNYFHKFILHNKRSNKLKERYFHKCLEKKLEKQANEVKLSLQILSKFHINEESSCQISQYEMQSGLIRSQMKINKKKPLQRCGSQQILISETFKQINQQKAGQQKETSLIGQKIQIEEKIKQFHEWIENLSVINFADYERVWTDNHQFTPLYKQLCYKYYKQEVICDVLRSRLTTKDITIKYINQFLEGLINPKLFYRFK